MKKALSTLLYLTLLSPVSGEVIAPALQYNNDNYPYAFYETSNYRIKLNTFSKYKLKCDFDITGVMVGDKDNLKISNDDSSEKTLYEMFGPNDVILKTKYETYTYISVHKANGKIIDILLSVNKENGGSASDSTVYNAGTCNLEAL